MARNIGHLGWALAALLLSIGAGCVDEYEPRVICHNSNCIEPTDPGKDSTFEALQASLKLFDEERGRPLLDGMEVDTFWWGEQERCVMAHDLDNPDRVVDALDAAEMITEALSGWAARGIPVTRQAERYTVLIELKGHVTESKADAHSPEQLAAHAACGVAMARELMDGADQGGYGLEVVLMSFAPAVLQALYDDPGLLSLRQREHPLRLAALQGIPRPLDSQTVPLDEFPADIGIDMVSVHPHWVDEKDRLAYRARGWEMGYWMFDLVPQTLDAIRRHRPAYITTNEALSLVTWLER